MGPVDSQNVCTISQFCGGDYAVWKFRLIALLREKELHNHISIAPRENPDH